MAIQFSFVGHTDILLHQLEANVEALGNELMDSVMEMIQDKMLYCYGDAQNARSVCIYTSKNIVFSMK